MKHSALSSLVPALIALISIIFVFPFIALCPLLTPASTSSVFSGKKKKEIAEGYLQQQPLVDSDCEGVHQWVTIVKILLLIKIKRQKNTQNAHL